MADTSAASVSLKEMVQLAAVDAEIFGRTFFPGTLRQATPPSHRIIDRELDDPTARFVNLQVHRDGAKTTKLRLFAARRVAFGTSRTILYIGASESHAIRSVRWLRSAVERNKLYAGTFGLVPGNKWQDHELEIINTVLDQRIWVLGVGIVGNIRGINFDDYRPDTIVLDDVVTDENAITLEQREKITDLVLGAVANSLAPRIEAPNAKMAMLQTPIHPEDVSSTAARSDRWRTVQVPCWTQETMERPVDEQISAWPERHPTDELRKLKKQHIAENKLSLFIREWECKLVSAETSAFKPFWLKYYGRDGKRPGPRETFNILAIDPVPPPSDREVAKELHGKAFEAVGVIGHSGEDYHVLDYRTQRGHEPNWTVATAFELAARYQVGRIVVEAVAYQRVLKYLLEQEMKRRGLYWVVVPLVDTRKKYNRIVSTLAGPGAHGHIWCGQEQSEFIEQWNSYPRCTYFDVLDMVAIGVSSLAPLSPAAARDPSLGGEDDSWNRERASRRAP
jgi:hypothetical protein